MTHSTADRADVRDMLVVHDAFRMSYGRMPALVLHVAPGDVRRAAIVADHIQLIAEFLHLHHKGEDDLLWPKLRDRAGDRLGSVVELLESQHEEIDALMAEASSELNVWRGDPSVARSNALADVLERLASRLRDHLEIEERDVLSLASEYLTAEEWHQFGDHAINGLPKSKLPIIFGMLASLAEPEVVTLMLSSAPLVPRLLMPVLGPRAYARHARRIFGPVAAPIA
ncbi:hemerythrin domain-containing protein [Actinacidiphila sp. bgisy160]|uniref:hemerythrin domain-containing protein n=1 Tax=Actinacidiphila sp. bgisy160 TaxID=3413796 RepID=UPI003D71EC44